MIGGIHVVATLGVECDDAIKCGSARGKAALLLSLRRKDRSFYTCMTYYVREDLAGTDRSDMVFGAV